MARFPSTEADVVALAEAMETGLAANVAIYPAPPVAVLDLTEGKLKVRGTFFTPQDNSRG
jgi:hypothetical protein